MYFTSMTEFMTGSLWGYGYGPMNGPNGDHPMMQPAPNPTEQPDG